MRYYKGKIGKFSPGKHIPIKNMDYFHNNMTDCVYFLLGIIEIFNKEKILKVNGFRMLTYKNKSSLLVEQVGSQKNSKSKERITKYQFFFNKKRIKIF